MGLLQTTVGLIGHLIEYQKQIKKQRGKFLNFLEAKAKMETQVLQSQSHMLARMHRCIFYLTTRNVLYLLLSSCVCVFQRLYESLKSTFPKMYSQEILVYIPSVRALMPQVLEAGRVVESLVQLEHWVWAVHILDHCSSSSKTSQAIPALGRQDLVVSLHHTTALSSWSSALFFSFFLIHNISLRSIL